MAAMTCVLKAIADPTRRTMLRSFSVAAELPASDFDTAPLEPVVRRHLRVLRRAGLLVEQPRGAGSPSYRLERARLRELATFLRSLVDEA
jgi:DNA-binding transcriptional ArsR family regulator